MLHPVWPSVYFWYFLGLCSSLLWLFPSMEMEFIKKSTPLVGVFVRLTILFSWFVGNTVLSIIFVSLIKNPRTDNFFRGYECVGKTVGCALVLFGNIGLYYYSEKSIACMLTFLFLGFYCLCALFYIQPFTDFGVLDFFLSASLTQALHLFGLHIYSWLVFIAVMVIAGLRYQLVPELLSQPSRKVESSRVANADSEGEARDKMERDSELSSVVIDRHSERIVSGVPNFQNLKKLYLSGLKQKLNDNLLNFTLWNRPCLDVTGTTSESQALELLHQPPVASCLAEGDGPEFDHLHDYISPFSHSSWFFSLPDLSVYRTPNPFTSGDGTNRGIPVRGLTTSAWW